MDEPELPPLPISLSTHPAAKRKRNYAEYEINTSSDPALFSSDDHKDASAEHYSSKKRKEQWKGTWWGDRLRNTSTRRKRSFKRNYDSGIFMGSEGTDTSLDEDFLADQDVREDAVESTRASSPPVYENYFLSTTKKVATVQARPQLVSTSHYQAIAIIQRALEAGIENVDLSSLLLETLPSEILSLRSLTKHDRIADQPAIQEAYSSIEAKLRLYLAHNSLKRLPSAVLELDNLRLLSLRQNNLTHIPCGIRRLVNLQNLNVSGNDLKYLPFEIIELFHHHSLAVLVADPNPWEDRRLVEGVDEISITDQKQDLTDCPCYLRIHVGKPSFFRANGTPRGNAEASTAAQTSRTKIPYLTELVLRRLTTFSEFSSVDKVITDELPESVQHMILEAQDAQSAGGRRCTKCHANLIMPRKQWLEWWSVAPGPGASLGRTLPFLRQQCHELCEGHVDDWTAEHTVA